MHKRFLLLCLIFLAAALLCGCDFLRPGQPTAPPEKSTSPPPVSPSLSDSLTFFSFTERSSYVKPIDGYEFSFQGDTPTASFYLSFQDEPYPVSVDSSWVDALEGIIDQYDMTQWNGFDKNAPGLLDGDQFYLSMSFASGLDVSARGYGRFPEHYDEATSEITALFHLLLPDEMKE